MTAIVKKTKKEVGKRRQHLRFTPEASSVAFVDLEMTSEKFQPSLCALILNQSYKGCGLITVGVQGLQPEMICRVKVGQLAPLKARIVWVTELEDKVYKLGLLFLQ